MRADGLGLGLKIAHQVQEALFVAIMDATLDQVGLYAAQFRKFSQQRGAAQRHDDIRNLANRRVGGQARESVGAATFHADFEVR